MRWNKKNKNKNKQINSTVAEKNIARDRSIEKYKNILQSLDPTKRLLTLADERNETQQPTTQQEAHSSELETNET